MAILFLGVGTWFMVLPSIDRGLAGALSSFLRNPLFFPPFPSDHGKTAEGVCVTRRFDFSTAFTAIAQSRAFPASRNKPLECITWADMSEF